MYVATKTKLQIFPDLPTADYRRLGDLVFLHPLAPRLIIGSNAEVDNSIHMTVILRGTAGLVLLIRNNPRPPRFSDADARSPHASTSMYWLDRFQSPLSQIHILYIFLITATQPPPLRQTFPESFVLFPTFHHFFTVSFSSYH